MSGYIAWIEQRRPVFSRLPVVYQENEVTDWLIAYWDEYLIQCKDRLDAMPDNLDPLVCPEPWLSYLAYLQGFKPDFWSDAWPTDLKRLLLFFAYRKIWPYKGLVSTINFVFDLFGLLVGAPKILTGTYFIVGVNKVGDRLGNPVAGYYIVQGNEYARNSPQWLLVDLITDKLSPAWTNKRQVYSRFIIGKSVIGDPLL